MKKVWEENPQTINELKLVVENFFQSLPEDLVRRTVSNILKRAELCIQNKGGHFENQLWIITLIVVKNEMYQCTDSAHMKFTNEI